MMEVCVVGGGVTVVSSQRTLNTSCRVWGFIPACCVLSVPHKDSSMTPRLSRETDSYS